MRKRIVYAAAVAALAVTGTSALTYHVYHNPRSAAAEYARRITRGFQNVRSVQGLVPAARNLMAPVHQGIKAEERLVLAGCDTESLVPADPVPVEGAVIPLDAQTLGEIAPLVIPDPTLVPEPCEPAEAPSRPDGPGPAEMPYCHEEGPPPMPWAEDGAPSRPTAEPPAEPAPPVERIPVMPCPVEEEEEGADTVSGRVRTRQLLRKLHRLYHGYLQYGPVHPEVDTMEFRPSDARLADYGFGPLF